MVLSSLLAQGIRPQLITMGDDGCSDVVVASEIARRFGLEHERIRLELDDLLEHGPDASALTNGTVPSRHWHTYIYPLKAGLRSGQPFFVGTLGEFARCHYFDRGFLGRLAGMASGKTKQWYWRAKLSRHAIFRDEELPQLAPELADVSGAAGTASRAVRLARLSRGVFLDGLARFYLEQVLPHFYAGGIKMYLASSSWRSPFHSREWIRAIQRLDARWKLGSNWHRFALQRNLPELLGFREERSSGPMSRQAPPLYWTPFRRRAPYVGYERSEVWFRSPPLRESLLDRADAIEDVIERVAVEAILEDHRRGADRSGSLAYLFGLMLWSGHVHEAR